MRSGRIGVALLAAVGLTGMSGSQVSDDSFFIINVSAGEDVSEELSPDDLVLPDGSFFDCYHLPTQRGRRYRVEMRSDAFDAYMAAGPGVNCRVEAAVKDDDSAGGTNPKVEFSGTGQVWFIRANSLMPNQRGDYELTVTELPR